jgi:hypothetical protein
MNDPQERGQAAFNRIEELGANAVWEPDLCAVDFSSTNIHDEDLVVFRDFPFVQILSLANTSVTDGGLVQLEQLLNLDSVDLSGTRVTDDGVDRLRRALPNTAVTLTPPDKSNINPFTGEPFNIKHSITNKP